MFATLLGDLPRPPLDRDTSADALVEAAVRAQEELLAQIRKAGGLHTTADRLVPVEHIFELQGVPEMKAGERKYAARKDGHTCHPSG